MKLKFILYIIFFLFAANVTAAGPITHVYIAQKWMDAQEKFDAQEENSFIRGTLFPDIRYLGVISRSETHEVGVSLHEIKKDPSPFSKGKKLHSFVDQKRERFVNKSKIYDQLKNVPGQKYIGTFLKLLEDEVLYREASCIKTLVALSSIDDSEKRYKINREDIIKWHLLLGGSFCMPPSKYIVNGIDSSLFNIQPEIAKKWSEILPVLAEDQNIKAYVSNLIKQFYDLFSKKY